MEAIQPLLWDEPELAGAPSISTAVPRPPVPPETPPAPGADPILAHIRHLAEWVFADYRPAFPGCGLRVELYPYTGLKHTLRRRHRQLHLRLCDLMSAADDEALTGIMRYLFNALLRRKTPAHQLVAYRRFEARPDIQALTIQRRQSRPAVAPRPPRHYRTQGRVRELGVHLERVYARYFSGEFPRPRIGWSRVAARRRLGVCLIEQGLVIINPRLDSKRVPVYVLEYIIFHELLHLRHGIRRQGGRNVIHSPLLRADERVHPDHARAEHFIRRHF